MPRETIIEVRNLNKLFPGTHALKDVSLEIRKGEVHSIVGANGAGKSTLMNILGGEYTPTDGTVLYNGKEVSITTPHQAISMGICVVYQELKLCENLNATQNIFLGHELRRKNRGLDWSRMKAESAELLDRMKADIDPETTVRNLTVGKKQLVEIARALKTDAQVLILDEPTSSLSTKDTEKLFAIVRELRDQGVTVIFISHRMDEVFSISDRITALRDGENLGTFEISETTTEKVVELIAGRSLADELGRQHAVETSEEVVLSVKNLSRGRHFSNISFNLHRGEILGIYGLQGAGRTEVLETLFGLEAADSGSVTFFGENVTNQSVGAMIDKGVILVPEDRRGSGIFARLNVNENVNSALPDGTVKGGFVQRKTWADTTRGVIERFQVKTSGLSQRMENLSGGNQQKVIIGKWLTKNPKVLLLDEVTRGIDVGAKAEIFRIIQHLRNDGKSVILVSSEVAEIIAECDRTLVMWNGDIVADIPKERMDRRTLMSHAMGIQQGD